MSEIFPDRPARPWDLFNKKIGRVTDIIAKERLDTCKQCDRYVALTHQCKECGCIMNAKTKLPNATCPLGKWDAFIPEIKIKEYTEEQLNEN